MIAGRCPLIINQFHGPVCASTIPLICIVPVKATAAMRVSPKVISYEIICTAPRMADRTEYLLFDPHPAKKTPNTPMLDIADTKKMPTLKSRMCAPLFQGRNEKVPTEAITTKNGAI